MSKVKVKVEKASNLISMDIIGKSDPFCNIHFEGTLKTTKIINNNLNPVWNEMFEFPVKHFYSILRFQVFDHDLLSKPDLQGSYEVSIAYLLPGTNSLYQHLIHPQYPEGCGTISLEIELFIPQEEMDEYNKVRNEYFAKKQH